MVDGKRRVFRIAVAVASLSGIVACAAVIGIEDRGPLGPDGGGGGGDSDTNADRQPPTDGPVVDDATADADAGVVEAGDDGAAACAACKTAGGVCEPGACVLDCSEAGACTATAVTCPATVPVCEVRCGDNACTMPVECHATKECRIKCSGTAACSEGIVCTGETCNIQCTGPSSCKSAPTSCDASSCNVTCTGFDSCDKAINAQATSGCSIFCGEKACDKSGENPSCNAPDSSITCSGTEACKDGVPTCTGQRCAVTCSGSSACANGHCCDAGLCLIDGSPKNACP